MKIPGVDLAFLELEIAPGPKEDFLGDKQPLGNAFEGSRVNIVISTANSTSTEICQLLQPHELRFLSTISALFDAAPVS